MKKNWKIWILLAVGFYVIAFMLFTKYFAQNVKKDQIYNEIGLNLDNSIAKKLNNLRAVELNRKQKVAVLKEQKLKNFIGSSGGGIKGITNYMIEHSKNQDQLNDSIAAIDTKFQTSKINDNFQTSLIAIPFTIKTIKSSKYYPDEHVIINKGEAGVHKITKINKLIREEVIKEPKQQVQFLGTKKYIKLPNLIENESFDYIRLIKKQQLNYQEVVLNPQLKNKKIKVFVDYADEKQLSHLKVNTKLAIQVKWLSKSEYGKIISKKIKEQKKKEEYLKAKENAIKTVSAFKYVDENEKIDFLNKLTRWKSVNIINENLKHLSAVEIKEASNNGIGTGKFIPPVQPAEISAGVSFHLANESLYAIDYSPSGSYPGSHKITAADSGIVYQAKMEGPYGNCVIVDHQNGYMTRYAHLNSFTVNVGDKVAPGTQLGWIGTTGNSTGTHVHFEIIKGQPGNTIDPTKFGLGY